MKVSLKYDNKKFTIPVPLFMGSSIIRCIPKNQLTKEQKHLAIQTFKNVKHILKEYKGLTIVEVDSSTGEHLKITI